MENVKVFQLNETEGVAAGSLAQAKEWYLEITGLNEEDAFYDYEATELPLTYEIWEDESKKKKQTLRSVIVELWIGVPFIAFSTEY